MARLAALMAVDQFGTTGMALVAVQVDVVRWVLINASNIRLKSDKIEMFSRKFHNFDIKMS